MSDIDKIFKDYRKKKVIECFKDPGSIINLLAIPSLITAASFTGGVGGTMQCVIAGFNISLLIKRAERYANSLSNLEPIIRETDEYKELVKAYNEYILGIANILENDDMSTYCKLHVFSELLSKSVLSVSEQYKGAEYSKDSIYLNELTGARVIQGTGVCRHVSVLLNDVLNISGQTSCVLTVSTKDDLISRIKGDHAVVGIVEDNKKYAFDPLRNAIYTHNNEIEDSKQLDNIFMPDDHLYLTDMSFIFNENNLDNLSKFDEVQFKQFTENDLEIDINEILRMTDTFVKGLTFKYNNKELYEKLSGLEDTIFPKKILTK